MATSPRESSLNREQRRALALLASTPDGIIEDLLVLTYEFDSDMIAGLVHTGLATARRDTVNAGGRTIEVFRIMITAVGWTALEG